MTTNMPAEPAPGYPAMLVLNPSNSRGLESQPIIIPNLPACDPGFNSIEFDGIKNGVKGRFAFFAIAEWCRVMIPQGSQKVAGVSEPRSGIDHRNLDRGAPTPAGVAQRGATPGGVGVSVVIVSGGLRRFAPTSLCRVAIWK